MRLTQQQFRQIQAALLDGYDRAGLGRLLRLELDISLDEITGATTDSQIVFDVIAWAERADKVPALIAAAAACNDGNELLGQLAGDATHWFEPADQSPLLSAPPAAAHDAEPRVIPPMSSGGGDIIIATVGGGAENVAIGKDIRQSSGGKKDKRT